MGFWQYIKSLWPFNRPQRILKLFGILFLVVSPFLVAWAISNLNEYITNYPKNNGTYGFVCPNDFTKREEYLNSLSKWIAEYTKDHPDADVDEMMSVRDGFIEKYGCGSAPPEEAQASTDGELDNKKLMAAIKQVESERPDEAADSMIKTTNEKELYDNPYIRHIRTALNGYLDGTMNGVEEGTAEKSELDGGYRCGLDSFDKNYYKSEFTVVKVEKNDYGGVAAYIAFLNKPDTIFWAWVYQYAGGDYILRGFCENAALIGQ